MTMLEQIARNMMIADCGAESWEACSESLQQNYFDMARSAIELMRNLNHAKTKAQRDTWHEMLDAILNEEDK